MPRHRRSGVRTTVVCLGILIGLLLACRHASRQSPRFRFLGVRSPTRLGVLDGVGSTGVPPSDYQVYSFTADFDTLTSSASRELAQLGYVQSMHTPSEIRWLDKHGSLVAVSRAVKVAVEGDRVRQRQSPTLVQVFCSQNTWQAKLGVLFAQR